MLACLVMADYLSRPHGESWGWFPIFALDFPASILVLTVLRDVPPLLAYGVVGSLWWALVAFIFMRIVDYVRNRRAA